MKNSEERINEVGLHQYMKELIKKYNKLIRMLQDYIAKKEGRQTEIHGEVIIPKRKKTDL